MGKGGTRQKPGQRLPLKSDCHCGSGRKYGKCCFQKDREASQFERYLSLFLMTHGTGDSGRTTDPRVLKSWAEIERRIGRLNIKFDKAYTDSSYERDGFPVDGITIPTSGNIDLQDFDPKYSILYFLAKKNPSFRWVPCESERLMEEYRSIVVNLKERESSGQLREEDVSRFTDIIYRRDVHIAQRIKEDLKIGEVGVLFLGGYHNSGNPSLEELLKDDGIVVSVRDASQPK